MKLTRTLLIVALVCSGALMLAFPAATTAQGPTPTPAIIIITATPVGGAPVIATVDPNAGAQPAVNPNATAEPPEWKAFNAARAYLSRKINKNLKYVNNWTWDLLLFPDSMLGCGKPGDTVLKGETAGYRFTIRPLGDPNTYEIRVSYNLEKVVDCGIAGTAPGAPALAGPVTGTASGGGFELGGHVLELNPNTVNAMRQAKMKWVKKQIRYGDGAWAGYIQQAKANGFKILLSVVGKPEEINIPGFFDQYAATVAQMAAAGADAIEIWNEMNLDREWPNGQISPARYTEMLAKAFNAIKAANPNTLVISGAPSPTGAAGAGGKTAAYWNDDVYMAEMAAAGAAQYADCIGVHYNEGIVSPNQSSGDPRDNYPTRYFGTMLNRALAAFPGKQACYTELGYLSPEGYGPLPGNFAWASNTTVAQQAQWLAQAAVLSAQSGRVRLMIVWNVDFPFYTPTDPMGGYSMIRPGGGCPACAALGQVMP